MKANIKEFINTIPKDVTIVCASKYGTSEDIVYLFNNGITNFGENKVNQFLLKYEALKSYPITWHFIGHLQRNKAKKIINKINYLHSLDSLELAKIIDKERTTPLNTFIEVSINLEENKNGVDFHNIDEFIEKILLLKNIHLVGLMMMGTKSSSKEELINQFQKLKDLKIYLEEKYHISLPYLSMGMSDDYLEAISVGATHIRLGRILFN